MSEGRGRVGLDALDDVAPDKWTEREEPQDPEEEVCGG